MNVEVESQEFISQIRKIHLFSYLTETELGKIVSIAEIVTYETGDKIIRYGEVSPFLYGIISGRVHVTLQEPDDQEVFISTIEEGAVFGESAIFMAEKRTANVTSSEKTVALRIHRKEMMSFIKENPLAGNKILMLIIYSLLYKLREVNQELAIEKQSVIDIDDIDSLVHDFMVLR